MGIPPASLQRKGTGNRKCPILVFPKNFSSDFRERARFLQSRKKIFFEMRSPEKTAPLFQSHVFKHEFSLFPLTLRLPWLKRYPVGLLDVQAQTGNLSSARCNYSSER
jgi:hypothetical protein